MLVRRDVQVGHQGGSRASWLLLYAVLVDGPEAEVDEDEDGSMTE